uniref:Actin-binding LIM protein 3 n=1 Tax=Macrostomum lignano TaxID=282301 RepID=A0A1I8I4M1_9PLAT
MKVYCLACQKRCKGEVLRVQEQYMHRDCFKCAECSAGLERGGFFVRDAKFYCPDDYQRLFGVKCRICAGYVVGEVITALGSTFHPSCFRCQTCRTPFTPGDRVTLWSNELYLCKACSHRERLKDEAASDTDPAGGLRVGTAPPTAAAAAAVTGNGAFDANTDTGTGHGLRSLPQHQHYPPQHYHHYHYLADGSSIRGGGFDASSTGPTSPWSTTPSPCAAVAVTGLSTALRAQPASAPALPAAALSPLPLPGRWQQHQGRRPPQPRQLFLPVYHYLADGSSIRGGGHHSPGSFSPAEASSSRRSRWGSQLARSYLTLEQEAERKLHPNDRYHRPASPCAAVASSTRSPSPQPQHFHLPMHRDGSRPRSRAHSLASSSRGAGTHPGSIGPRRPASVAGGGRPRTPRTPSPAPSLDPNEDPLLLSHYPAGSRPDLAKPAPIERDDWPCPPLPALLLAERQRQRRREAEGAAASADEAAAAQQQPAASSRRGFRDGSRSGASSNPAGWSSAASAPPCCSARTIRPPPPPPSRASRLQRMQQQFQQTPRPQPQLTASRRPPVPSPQGFRRQSRLLACGRPLQGGQPAAARPPPAGAGPSPADAAAAAARRESRYAKLLAASDDEDLLSYPNILGLHATGGPLRLHRPAPPPPRQFDYEALRRHSGAKQPPRGADPTRLEAHLSDEEFVHVFGMERRHFQRLPEWRRSDLKRKADLF